MIRNSKLQKLPVDILVVPQSVISFKTGPFVGRNTAEFTNVSCCTSLLLCSTHFTLSYRVLFSPFPPATIFSSLCVLKSPESLPGGSSFRTLGVVCFSGIWRSSEFDLAVIWASDNQDLVTSCRKFLYLTLLFVSVLYTQNALKSAQLSRYSTTFFNHFKHFLRIE